MIRCFVLENTGRSSLKLRRYTGSRWDEALRKSVYDKPCPLADGCYHNAEIRVDDGEQLKDDLTASSREVRPGDGNPYDGDPRWPAHCACGYAFTDDDTYQLFSESLWRREDTGEEMTLRDAPAGAMWLSPWYDIFHKPQLAHCLVVKLPNGIDWVVDSQATNCTIPDDHKQERHHCWVIEGELPNITAGKSGPTCSAGAGSIQAGNYHGYLEKGYLTENRADVRG